MLLLSKSSKKIQIIKKMILLVVLFIVLSDTLLGQTLIDSLQGRVDELENELISIDKTLVELKAQTGLVKTFINMFFWSLAIAVSINAAISTYFQRRQDKIAKEDKSNYLELLNDHKKEQELYREKQDEYRKGQDEKWQGLLDKVKDNIQRTTEFIGSLDEMFKISGKAKELDDKFKKLKEEEEERKARILSERESNLQHKKEIVRKLNEKAIRVSSRINKNNFSNKYNLGQCKELASQVNPIIALGDTEQLSYFNGDIYSLLAIDLALEGQYKDAVNHLNTSIDFVQRAVKKERIDILFPDKDRIAKVGSIEAWNRRLIVFSLFQKALIFFRQGKYKDAEIIFDDAIKQDPLDVDLRFLKAECKYWGQRTNFEDVIEEFSNIEQILENTLNPEMNLARLNYYKGNCYFPFNSNQTPFPSKKDIKLAGKMYNQANEYLDKALSKDNLITYHKLASIPFASAQVSLQLSSSNPKLSKKFKAKADSLFERAIQLASDYSNETDDSYTLYILNYIQAAACSYLDKKAKAKMFLMTAQEDLREFATTPNFRIFSPLTKRMLEYKNLKKEIQEFDRQKT